MKIVLQNKKVIVRMVIIALFCSIGFGYYKFIRKEELRQELNLEGLFVNVQGIDVKTEADYWGEKPYKTIRIKIPSFASKGDDATKESDNKVNQIINREELDKGVTKWLKNVFNRKETKRYTNHIEVWYRDDKIVDEKYSK